MTGDTFRMVTYGISGVDHCEVVLHGLGIINLWIILHSIGSCSLLVSGI
jgi:hypothetical protein